MSGVLKCLSQWDKPPPNSWVNVCCTGNFLQSELVEELYWLQVVTSRLQISWLLWIASLLPWSEEWCSGLQTFCKVALVYKHSVGGRKNALDICNASQKICCRLQFRFWEKVEPDLTVYFLCGICLAWSYDLEGLRWVLPRLPSFSGVGLAFEARATRFWVL